MKSNAARRTSPARTFARLLLAALAAALLPCAATHAQQQPGGPDSAQAYKTLMERRAEMTARAVDETQRRRFEEGKPQNPFPSDADKKSAAKPGMVRAVSPEEQQALAHTSKGLDYFSRSKFEQAVKEYDEAIRLYPTLAAAHNDRGSALFALGRFQEAAACFSRAVEIDPKYAQAHFNLALAYIKLGREKEAGDALNAAAHAYLAAGDEHIQAGELKEAEDNFKGLLQIDPDYAPARLKLGLVYNAARRYDEAVQSLSLVVAKQPRNAEAFENLGEAYAGQRKYTEALAASEQAINLQPNAPGAHYIAGLASASLGRREQALAHLDKLKQLKADDYAKLLADFIEKKAPGKQ
jgi:tetratricopeptide (TPR) repeat protein